MIPPPFEFPSSHFDSTDTEAEFKSFVMNNKAFSLHFISMLVSFQ